MFQSPASGAAAPTESFTPEPRREQVRHLLVGPPKPVERTIRMLYVMGYADPNDWSPPILLGEGGAAALAGLFEAQPGDVVRVLAKHLLME